MHRRACFWACAKHLGQKDPAPTMLAVRDHEKGFADKLTLLYMRLPVAGLGAHTKGPCSSM